MPTATSTARVKKHREITKMKFNGNVINEATSTPINQAEINVHDRKSRKVRKNLHQMMDDIGSPRKKALLIKNMVTRQSPRSQKEEIRQGIAYYTEDRKIALVSCYCIVGICPVEETVQEKRCGITEEMLFVGVELHIALTELVRDDCLAAIDEEV